MKFSSKWINISGVSVFCLMTGVIVILTLKNQELKDQIREVTGFEQTDPLEPGTKVGDISVTLLDGGGDTVSYTDDHSKYLLFVFSTTCPHCEATIPHWKSIKDRVSDDCFPIALSIHDAERTNQYVRDKDFPFYTVCLDDSNFNAEYKISGVPVTILISGKGVVQNVWRGRLDDEQVAEIFSALNESTTASLIHK